jgi:hypothetical protein
MEQRFQDGRCLTVDDNAVWFKGLRMTQVLEHLLTHEIRTQSSSAEAKDSKDDTN